LGKEYLVNLKYARDDNIKITMLTSSFPRYKGDMAGKPVYLLARELIKNDIDVDIVSPLDCRSKRYEKFDDISVNRFQYFIPIYLQNVAYKYGIPENLRISLLAKTEFPFFLLFFFLKGLKIAKNSDLVHVHWLICGLIAVPIKKLIHKKIVLTVRGSDLRKFPSFITRFILDNSDIIISPHPELTNIINSLGTYNITEIRNLVDDEEFNPNLDIRCLSKEFDIRNKHVVSFIGRLNEFKDPLTFVRAIPHILIKNKKIKFFVVGDGALKEEVLDCIQELNLQDYVYVTGFRSDINSILRASTIYAAISPIENLWSNVIVEAMKCRVPCIVTKSGTASDILAHKINAYLIPPKDEIALANAVLYLLNDHEMRNVLSENGILLIKNNGFLNEEIVKNTIKIYKNLIGRKSNGD